MAEEPTEQQDSAHEYPVDPAGKWTQGDITVTWRWHSGPPGYEIEVDACKGQRRRAFLTDGDTEWCDFPDCDPAGIKLEAQQSGDDLVLLAGVYQSHAEQISNLTVWKQCDYNSGRPEKKDNDAIGWGITLDWTISGCDDECRTVWGNVYVNRKNIGEFSLDPENRSTYWEEDLPKGVYKLSLNLDFNVETKIFTFTSVICLSSKLELKEIARHSDYHPTPPIPPLPPRDESGICRDKVLWQPLGARRFASIQGEVLYPHGSEVVRPLSAFTTANAGAFQSALKKLHDDTHNTGGDIFEAYCTEAHKYLAGEGEYMDEAVPVSEEVLSLAAQVEEFLKNAPTEIDALYESLREFLGQPPEAFLKTPMYKKNKPRVQDTLLAHLILESNYPAFLDGLVNGLVLAYTVEMVVNNWDRLKLPEAIETVLQAAPYPPPNLFPIPLKSNGGDALQYGRLLGLNWVRTIWCKLKGYRYGALAQVENVMRGEQRDYKLTRSWRSDDKQVDTSSNENKRKATSFALRAEEDIPLLAFKREFDNLKQAYGDGGLTVTQTGGWTDEPVSSGDGKAAASFTGFIQQRVCEAANRVADRVDRMRERQLTAELEQRFSQQYDNQHGEGHDIGLYYWVNELYEMRCDRGRLCLGIDFFLPDPGKAYVEYQNSLRPRPREAPVPPWENTELGPINTPADITEENAPKLAQAYEVATVSAPPAAELGIVQTMSGCDGSAKNEMQIPVGYTSQTVSAAVIAIADKEQTTTKSFSLLVGEKCFTVTAGAAGQPQAFTATGNVPIAATGPVDKFTATVQLSCQRDADNEAYRLWQFETFELIYKGYYRLLNEYESAALHAADAGADDDVEFAGAQILQREGINQLIAERIARVGPISEAERLRLLAFFQRAFLWDEALYALCANDKPGSGDLQWLHLDQSDREVPSLRSVLAAQGVRLLAPVRERAIPELLYFFCSKGMFWRGSAAAAPVFSQGPGIDILWQWKRHQSKPIYTAEPYHWPVELATTHMILQQDDKLPCSFSTLTTSDYAPE